MSSNFFALKLLVAIQDAHTLNKCDREYTVVKAKYFAEFLVIILII